MKTGVRFFFDEFCKVSFEYFLERRSYSDLSDIKISNKLKDKNLRELTNSRYGYALIWLNADIKDEKLRSAFWYLYRIANYKLNRFSYFWCRTFYLIAIVLFGWVIFENIKSVYLYLIVKYL